MQPTEEQKFLVWRRIHESIQKIRDHYGVEMEEPTIDYDLRGTTAGMAYAKRWHISLNAGLLVAQQDAFLLRTVPHEFAHLAVDRLYPNQMLAAPDPVAEREFFEGKRNRRPRSLKRDIHGPKWQEVMGVLGVDPSRCHSYDTSTTHRPKVKYEYVCPRCSRSYVVGPKVHNNQQLKPNSYYCGDCYVKGDVSTKRFLKFSRSLGQVNWRQAGAIVRGEAEPGPAPKYQLKMKEPTGNTKMARCWQWYIGYVDKYDRTDMISVFVNECGCTPAGAATYYANCKKLYNAGV